MTVSSNALFAFPNYVDSTTVTVAFSGGDWEPTMPLENLANPLLSRVARSVDLDLASTQFVVDLGASRRGMVLSVPRSNLSLSALYRVTAATDSGFSDVVYQSDWTDVFTKIYPFESLAFEDISWWTGKLSEEDAPQSRWPLIAMIDPVTLARYWKLEIDDSGNDDGYVELARLVIAPGWQPTLNISYGSGVGWTTSTVAKESLGGVVYFDARVNRRIASLPIDYLPLVEALQNLFEMQRNLGTNQQFMLIYDPTDTVNTHRRSFLATLTNIGNDLISEVMYGAAQVRIEAQEVI